MPLTFQTSPTPGLLGNRESDCGTREAKARGPQLLTETDRDRLLSHAVSSVASFKQQWHNACSYVLRIG